MAHRKELKRLVSGYVPVASDAALGFCFTCLALPVCMWVTLVSYHGMLVTEVCETWVMTMIQRKPAVCASVYMCRGMEDFLLSPNSTQSSWAKCGIGLAGMCGGTEGKLKGSPSYSGLGPESQALCVSFHSLGLLHGVCVGVGDLVTGHRLC